MFRIFFLSFSSFSLWWSSGYATRSGQRAKRATSRNAALRYRCRSFFSCACDAEKKEKYQKKKKHPRILQKKRQNGRHYILCPFFASRFLHSALFCARPLRQRDFFPCGRARPTLSGRSLFFFPSKTTIEQSPIGPSLFADNQNELVWEGSSKCSRAAGGGAKNKGDTERSSLTLSLFPVTTGPRLKTHIAPLDDGRIGKKTI